MAIAVDANDGIGLIENRLKWRLGNRYAFDAAVTSRVTGTIQKRDRVTATNQLGIAVPAASTSITVVNGVPAFASLSAAARLIAEGEALIVLSGGAAALIEPRLNAKVVLVDNLVLEGVLAIARDAHEAMNATHLNPGGTVK